MKSATKWGPSQVTNEGEKYVAPWYVLVNSTLELLNEDKKLFMKETAETDEYKLRAYWPELFAVWVYLHVYSVCLSAIACIFVVYQGLMKRGAYELRDWNCRMTNKNPAHWYSMKVFFSGLSWDVCIALVVRHGGLSSATLACLQQRHCRQG